MPLFDFHCKACENTFELLVRGSSVPQCSACGSTDIEKLVSAPQAPGKTGELINRARSQAAKEGHFSNYRASEIPRSRK